MISIKVLSYKRRIKHNDKDNISDDISDIYSKIFEYQIPVIIFPSIFLQSQSKRLTFGPKINKNMSIVTGLNHLLYYITKCYNLYILIQLDNI